MTTIHLTDHQRDTFAACGLIVIDGERWQGDCELCDNTRAVFDRWRTNAIVGRHEIYKPCPQCATTQGEAAWVAPEGWRILTELCDTCGGMGTIASDNAGSFFIGQDVRPPCPNPDCVGGRRVVTLTATCPLPHNAPGWIHGNLGEVVTLGRFTIPALLPVVDESADVSPVRAIYRWTETDVTTLSTLRLRPGQFLARPEAVA